LSEAFSIYRRWGNAIEAVSQEVPWFKSIEPNTSSEKPSVVLTSKLECGSVLIAHPLVQHGHMRRSVIYILEHNEHETKGVILNRVSSDIVRYNIEPKTKSPATSEKTDKADKTDKTEKTRPTTNEADFLKAVYQSTAEVVDYYNDDEAALDDEYKDIYDDDIEADGYDDEFDDEEDLYDEDDTNSVYNLAYALSKFLHQYYKLNDNQQGDRPLYPSVVYTATPNDVENVGFKSIYQGGYIPSWLIVHSLPGLKHSRPCGPGLYYTTKPEEFKYLIKHVDPKEYSIYNSYSSWDTAKLTQNIKNGRYIVAKAPLGHLFSHSKDPKTTSTTTTTTTTTTAASSEEERKAQLEDSRILQNKLAHEKAKRMWSSTLQSMGGEFYHLAFIDKQTFTETMKGVE